MTKKFVTVNEKFRHAGGAGYIANNKKAAGVGRRLDVPELLNG
ncbi:MAG TPA: hypothetical protein VGL89_02810 [Candidatus Koribacter sp.]|jgi:hypothetical protein